MLHEDLKYLDLFVLEWEKFQIKFVRKSKQKLVSKSYYLRDSWLEMAQKSDLQTEWLRKKPAYNESKYLICLAFELIK